MDQIQKIINSKARAIAGEKKKVDLNLVVEVSDDSDFEDVLVTKAIARDIKPVRKINNILKVEKPKKVLKKHFIPIINIKEKSSKNNDFKPIIRSEEDIVKEMHSFRGKGKNIPDHRKFGYYNGVRPYIEFKKELDYILTEMLWDCDTEKDILLTSLLQGVWRRIKSDNYVKRSRVKEIKALLKRIDELDEIVEKEREERKRLQQKLNDLKKVLS